MHLVNHEHLHANGLHDPQRRLLHLRDVGARPLWRAEQGEEFRVEPSFAGATCHFHRQNRRPQSSGRRVDIEQANRTVVGLSDILAEVEALASTPHSPEKREGTPSC